MTSNAHILDYFMQASLIVKLVMLFLLTASMISWTLIFQRYWFFRQEQKQYDTFNQRFWDNTDLSQLYVAMTEAKTDTSGLSSIFQTGFKEYLRVRKHDKFSIGPIKRSMQIVQTKEALYLEEYLPFFASVGSIAPYIGLFGTVWGIMTSFQALGKATQATIAMVAPGISEALVATALGLFTAIPAVIAYNRYSTSANKLLANYQLFQDEFIALIEQQY